MTPKEQYEVRKARRKAQREALEVLGHDDRIADITAEEALDRISTALERIADSLERMAAP